MQQEIPPSDDKNTAWDQRLDLSGDNFGFGPTSPNQYQPTMQPQPSRSSNRRPCLLIAGGLVMVCLIVCACLGYFVYQGREIALVLGYQQFLAQNQAQDVIESQLICPNSQAERFHEAFIELYPGKVEIDAPTTTLDGDTHQVRLEGMMTHNGETVDYEAIFTIDPDGEFLYVFGCISEIKQILPPLIPPLG